MSVFGDGCRSGGGLGLGVVLCQSADGGLDDGADLDAAGVGGFGEFGLVVVGDAADEVDGGGGEVGHPRGGEDVAGEELCEAVEQKGVDGRMVAMACAEGAEAGEVAVGEGKAIDVLDDGGDGLVGLVEEGSADVVGELAFEDVAHEAFADVGSAAFVAKDVAEGGDALVEGMPVVVAGVAACAEDGDDAALSSAEPSGGAEHVALYFDFGGGADALS